jgi:hypothetical protein
VEPERSVGVGAEPVRAFFFFFVRDFCSLFFFFFWELRFMLRLEYIRTLEQVQHAAVRSAEDEDAARVGDFPFGE